VVTFDNGAVTTPPPKLNVNIHCNFINSIHFMRKTVSHNSNTTRLVRKCEVIYCQSYLLRTVTKNLLMQIKPLLELQRGRGDRHVSITRQGSCTQAWPAVYCYVYVTTDGNRLGLLYTVTCMWLQTGTGLACCILSRVCDYRRELKWTFDLLSTQLVTASNYTTIADHILKITTTYTTPFQSAVSSPVVPW
jgi:hypothetical protein